MGDRLSDEELDVACKLRDEASDYIEMENVGRPYMPDYEPTAESKAFYRSAHAILPRLITELRERRAADITYDDRCLVLEVCHDLINKAMRLRCDEFGSLDEAARLERTEATIRRILDAREPGKGGGA